MKMEFLGQKKSASKQKGNKIFSINPVNVCLNKQYKRGAKDEVYQKES